MLTQALLETREGVEMYFSVISKIRRLTEDIEITNGELPVLDSLRGCPTCGQLDGFHDNPPHAAARAAIPSKLTWRPSEVPVYRRGQ